MSVIHRFWSSESSTPVGFNLYKPIVELLYTSKSCYPASDPNNPLSKDISNRLTTKTAGKHCNKPSRHFNVLLSVRPKVWMQALAWFQPVPKQPLEFFLIVHVRAEMLVYVCCTPLCISSHSKINGRSIQSSGLVHLFQKPTDRQLPRAGLIVIWVLIRSDMKTPKEDMKGLLQN